jgi:cytochrome c oxidase assembly protein Cox11
MQLLGVARVPIYRCACVDTSVSITTQRPKYPMNPLAQPVESAHLSSAFQASKGQYKMSQISVDVRTQIDILYQKLAMLETTVAKNQGLETELLIGLKAFSSLLSGIIVYRSRDL